MSGDTPYGVSITIQRPAARDRTGDTVGAPSTHTIDGCVIGWGQSTVDRDARETALWDATVYAPTGSDVKYTDRIVLPGDDTVYVPAGRPQRWGPHPITGWQPRLSVVVPLKAVS